jgi:CysZ protein
LNPAHSFWLGIKAYGSALKLIFATQMWLAFAIPILLSIGLYYGGDMLTDNLKAYRFEQLDEAQGSDYLLLGIQFILVYVTKFMNKYLVLILLSPLLAGLSAHAERRLAANTYPFSWEYYGKDVVRAILISLRNIGIQLLWMAAFFLVTLLMDLPDWMGSVFYLLVAFYFYGFSFMDYANERRRLSLQDSVRFTRKHWPTTYALGAIYGALFFIPDFGFALQPGVVLAPILGTVAGTIVVHEIVDLRQNPHAVKVDEPVITLEATDHLEQADAQDENPTSEAEPNEPLA